MHKFLETGVALDGNVFNEISFSHVFMLLSSLPFLFTNLDRWLALGRVFFMICYSKRLTEGEKAIRGATISLEKGMYLLFDPRILSNKCY